MVILTLRMVLEERNFSSKVSLPHANNSSPANQTVRQHVVIYAIAPMSICCLIRITDLNAASAGNRRKAQISQKACWSTEEVRRSQVSLAGLQSITASQPMQLLNGAHKAEKGEHKAQACANACGIFCRHTEQFALTIPLLKIDFPPDVRPVFVSPALAV